jgi:hypothetical protein
MARVYMKLEVLLGRQTRNVWPRVPTSHVGHPWPAIGFLPLGCDRIALLAFLPLLPYGAASGLGSLLCHCVGKMCASMETQIE